MLEFQFLKIFFLLPLPLLVYWLLPAARQTQAAALRVPFYQTLTEIKTSKIARGKVSSKHLLFLFLIWLLLLLAAAKPVWLSDEIVLPAKGRDLMLAVDLSGSMQHTDMKIQGQNVTRLTAVKVVLKSFIEKRKGDRIGLILFGTNAYLQSPLTFDYETLTQYIMEAEIGIAGEATAIGDAIGLAIKRLQNNPAASRVLILLTDGSNNAGVLEPVQAAQLAREKSLRIHTIGMGADSMETGGVFGSSFFSRMVNPSYDLDEETLQQVADITGGNYFRARDTQSLEEIYQLLDQIEAIDADHLTFRPKKSLFHWFLSAALLLSWLYCLFVLLNNRYNKHAFDNTQQGN